MDQRGVLWVSMVNVCGVFTCQDVQAKHPYNEFLSVNVNQSFYFFFVIYSSQDVQTG